MKLKIFKVGSKDKPLISKKKLKKLKELIKDGKQNPEFEVIHIKKGQDE